MQVAILGFGTIGRGVYHVINNLNKKYDVKVKYVFDLPIKKKELGDLLVSDIDIITNDSSIDVVVEVLGGHDFPYSCTKKCLEAGKSVVTANKEVVSSHLEEFINLAHKNKCHYLFEASVGGGIPIIRPLIDNIKVNDVTHIIGIINGTTNYLLTKMQNDNLSFDEALKLAQKNGFAEANPTADLEGLDMVRKINILSSLAYKGNISNDDIYHYGISSLTTEIIKDINSIGYILKFVSESKNDNNTVSIKVEPVLIKENHPFNSVRDEFNAIILDCTTNDILEFYGKGAGSLPTATAVVSDIVSIFDKRADFVYANENKLVIKNEINQDDKYYLYLDDNSSLIKDNVTLEELKNAKFYAKILD